jgi:hypothetical protein
MKRHEIIYELAKYAHPSWYHDLLSWKTWQLKILLDYYKRDIADNYQTHVGIDLAADIEEGRLKDTQSVANGFVEGKVLYTKSERVAE